MKQLGLLVAAALLGAILALGGFYLLQPSVADQATPSEAFTYAQQTNNINQPVGTVNVPFDFKEAARRATPAVVHISASSGMADRDARNQRGRNPLEEFFGNPNGGSRPQAGSGSGVIYTADGYIITNNHVVDFADQVEVTTYDNRTYKAKVIGTDPTTDIAVLKIEAEDLPTLRVADSDRAQVGEWALAVGNPFDLTSTVTAGIISAKSRSIDILGRGASIEAFIQTDAAVNPGNSGGALVNSNGDLIGINTAIASRTGSYAGYSFAVPSKIATKVADDIIEFGSTQRGLVGISISDLDNARARQLGIDITQGVVVEGVTNGGAAQYAGILPNDVIVRVDDRKVKTGPELQELVGRKRPGETVTLDVLRDGRSRSFDVKLRAADQ